jgi:polyisoprenyl-teichoic acid--peptidoglycan teichoic acid transferase
MKGAALLVLVMMMGTAGAALYLHSKFIGGGLRSILRLPETLAAMRDPGKYFPGQRRITVLCLGLDRNIFKSRDPKLNGMPYTKGARSDVMMVASLDLETRQVSILSIPRDTRVRLPSQRGYAKINQAHADGGIPGTREAVEQFLGVPLDYHVVIKQEAIQAVVDALGGLRLKVEKDMDYDDNWGQLHVHLKAGEQVLNGEQVVGYMRFRHDDEGDFGRIRRQQQVIQTLSQEVKKPAVLFKAAGVIDAIQKNVFTDLTKEQQIALSHLFNKVEAGNLQTVSLPIADTATIGGISYVIPDDDKKEAVVDWIVRGNQDAMNRLIHVQLKNASGSPESYQHAYRYLRYCGFEVTRAGRASGGPIETTRVVQRTNLRGSGRRLLDVLGLRGSVEKLEDEGPDVTLYVGRDLVDNPILADADSLPEPPDSPTPRVRHSSTERRHRPRRAARVEDPVIVDVQSVAADVAQEQPAVEVTEAPVEAPSVPGTAESQPTPAVPTPAPASTPSPPTKPESQ